MTHAADSSRAAMQTPDRRLVEHWLLNTAIEFPRSINLILPHVAVESLNVKPVPGCGAADYAKSIADLFSAGLIRIDSDLPAHDFTDREGILRVLEEIQQMGRPAIVRSAHRETLKRKFFFELTAKGGAEWERRARPEWENFYSESSDGRTGDAVSPNLTLLMARLGWFAELNGQRIHRDTIELEEHQDYQVLYWTRLPHVYRALFCCEPGGGLWGREDGTRAHEPKWFTNWWHATNRWYTEPWELAGWPGE
jgi:hypothetical protein